jgi:putative membrane protein
MERKMKIKTLALFAVLAGSALAYADDPKMKSDMADKSKSAKLTDDEQKVISHQHMMNTMAIDAAQYAQKNAAAPAVKDYAKTVVADQQKLDRDLTSFAKQHGVAKIAKPMATTDEEKRMHEEHTAQLTKLKTLKGADLDKTFLRTMVTTQENELAKIDSVVANIQNPDLKRLVEDSRPILQNHADKAKELQKQIEQTSMREKKTTDQPVAPSP